MAIFIIIVLIIITLIVLGIINSRKKQALANELMAKAGQGDAQAQFDLGLKNKKGKCFYDIYEAIKWFKKADEQGFANAKMELESCKIILENRINEFEKKIKKYKFMNYEAVYNCCIELIKNGYECHYSEIKEKNEGCYIATIHAWNTASKSGVTIEFGNLKHEYYTKYNIFIVYHTRREITYGKHMLQLDKASIIIESDVLSSEAPPEGMMICAKVLAQYCTICYPDWVEQNPEAKEYVNVAFKKLGLL